MTALRILVAGAGLFGCEHLDRLVKREAVRVVGVADPSTKARDSAQARYRFTDVFADAASMLEQVAADGVIIASSSATHVELTLKALDRGMAVLLEKPVARSPEMALHLATVAKGCGKLVLPGHVLRFSEDHRRVAEIVASGGIGKPLYINSRRYRDDSHAERYGDIDPILMTLIHDIDLALWLAGSSFRSAQAHRQPGNGFRSITAATGVTETGVICDLRTAWTFASGDLPPDRVEVLGDAGSVELELGRGLSHFSEGKRREVALVPADDALANEQTHFLDCLRDPKRKSALTLQDAAHGLRLAEALLQSIRTGRAVEVAP